MRLGFALRPLLGVAVVLAAATQPTVTDRVPVLLVLCGPLGWVLLLLAAAVALAPFVPDPRQPPQPWLLFAAAALLLGAIGLHYAANLRAFGDEPHYLIMAQSLWREGDLDLRDNYARQDFLEYTPGPLVPHYAAPRSDGRPFPAHSPGLPLLLAPAYALGGRTACVLLLVLIVAALANEVRLLALQAGADPASSAWAWAASVGPPAGFYAFHLYTEAPSALALAVSLRLLLSVPGAGAAAAAALLASTLPWLHLKMAPAASALGLIALWRLRGVPRLAFVAVAAVAAVGFLAYYHAIFGTASPLAIYGGVPADATGSPPRAMAGLLLDRSFGLLPFAPLLVLALAGVPRLRQPALVLVAISVLGPLLTWRMWWGGQCPPARFLVPLLPVLGVCLALRLRSGGYGLARWRGVLLGLGAGLLVYAGAQPGGLLLVNRGDRPTRLWASLSGAAPVERYLPSLVSTSPQELRVAMVWLAALCVLLGLDALARRIRPLDRAFAGFELALVLLLSIGIAVDAWARAQPTRRSGYTSTSTSLA
jgi:hypothetical protein